MTDRRPEWVKRAQSGTLPAKTLNSGDYAANLAAANERAAKWQADSREQWATDAEMFANLIPEREI